MGPICVCINQICSQHIEDVQTVEKCNRLLFSIKAYCINPDLPHFYTIDLM